MYKIYLGDQVIYDTTDKDSYPISDPDLKLPLKDTGSLEFKVFPDHPQFSNLKAPFKFIKVTRDNEEIFYGRTLRNSKNLGDALTITCEGALNFLNDVDMAKLDSVSETVTAFFTRCINAYNSQVESAKQFTIGNVSVDKASSTEKFSISKYQKVKDVLTSQLINRFGGFLRIRPNANGAPFIDYVSAAQFTTTYNSKKIKIAENIISKEDKSSGEKCFSILRPLGDKDIDITGKTQTELNALISNCTLSGNTIEINELKTEYGNIINTVQFTSATKDALLAEAAAYITKIRSHLPSSVDVNWVDFHHLNPSVDYVEVGDSFSNIEGFDGQIMTATELNLNLEDASKDNLVLENAECIELSNNGRNGSGGVGSASGGGSFSGYAGQQWKYYHEMENTVQIHTDTIEILAEEELTLAGKVTQIVASDKMLILVQNSGTGTNTLSLGYLDMHNPVPAEWTVSEIDKARFTYNSTTGHWEDNNGLAIEEVKGSNIWIGKDHITAVAGCYEVVGDPAHPGSNLLRLVQGAELQIRDDNIWSTVASTKAVNKKAAVYRQWTDPANDSPAPTLYPGDIWIKDNGIRTWDDVSQGTWNESSANAWRDYFGSCMYVRVGEGATGEWVKQNDAASIVENTTKIDQTDDHISLLANTVSINGKDTAELKVTSQEISATVRNISNDQTIMQGQITVQSNKIGLVVEEKNGQNVIRSASIMTAINNDTSSVVISADEIDLSGYVKATDITANYIASKIADISSVHVQTLVCDSGGYIMAPGYYLGTIGNAANLSRSIWALRIAQSGDTYTLQKQDYDDSTWVDVGSFSRATSLSGAWSGSNYVVTATPQSETLSVSMAPDMYPNGTTDIFTSGTLPSGATNLGSLASSINSNVGRRLYVCFYAGVSADGAIGARKLYALAIN